MKWLKTIMIFAIMISINLLSNCLAADNTKIHFIRVGGSDAFLLESNGHFGLIDSSNPYNDGTEQSVNSETSSVKHVIDYIKKVGVKKLDFVLATHSHSDHIGGMPEIARNFVDKNTKYYYREYVQTTDDIYHPEYDNEGYYQRAINEMKKYNAQLTEVTNKTPSFGLGSFTIQLLNTEPASQTELVSTSSGKLAKGENKNSIVALVKYGDKKILFTADMEIEDEARLIQNYGNEIANLDVLKMGHHGIASATSISFVKKVNPLYIMISNGSFPEKR